ncbi:NUDIX domain-containing protein [Micrococcales bacterium 31B]|nr:NUDIX domain-containing protein [Micrococcales bacterium 31B]
MTSSADGSARGDSPAQHTLLNSVRAALLRYLPASDSQETLRREYLAHLDQFEAAGLLKSGPPQHVTASCFVFNRELTHILLTLHAKARAWVQFGGHLEPGDASIEESARREAREESGLPLLELLRRPDGVAEPLGGLDRHDLDAAFSCAQHLDVAFVALTQGLPLPAVSHESLDVAWVPLALFDEAEADAAVAFEGSPFLPDVPARALGIARQLREGRVA